MIPLQSNESEKKTFRILLKQLLSDNDVSAILIGENHERSSTIPALLANIDLLENSKRNVILVNEGLFQNINQALTEIASKQNREQLAKIEDITEKEFDLFELYQMLISKGILVLGAENQFSNPFGGVKKTQEVVKQMKQFVASIDRIVSANEVFSEFINNHCNKDSIVIFIGGSTHPIALKQIDKEIDPGMQNRIPKSKSLFLLRSAEPNFQDNFIYENSDKGLNGVYDYFLEANAQILFENTFDDLKDIEEKKQFFINHLDNLIQSYLLNDKIKSSIVLTQSFEKIGKAFSKSVDLDLDFAQLKKLKNEIVQQKSTADTPIKPKPKSFLSKFSFQNKSESNVNINTSISTYSKEKLQNAINADLLIINQNQNKSTL